MGDGRHLSPRKAAWRENIDRVQAVALDATLITMAMLLAHRLALQLPGTVKRLQAGNAAMRAIESSLETLRAGNLPLMDDVLMPPAAYPDGIAVEDLILVESILAKK